MNNKHKSEQLLSFELFVTTASAFLFLSYYFVLRFIPTKHLAIPFHYPVVIISALVILLLPYIVRTFKLIPLKSQIIQSKNKSIRLSTIILSFAIFCSYLSFFSWDGTVGFFYSISALIRYIWLFYSTQINSHTSKKYIYFYLLCTLILAFVDTQRTTIILCFLVAIYHLRLSFTTYIISLSLIVTSLTSIAAIRNGQQFDIFGNIIYGFSAETYLATLSYVQAYSSINFTPLSTFYHFIYLVFSPLIYVINKILSYFPISFDTEYLFPDLFQEEFGEYNELGGHFIGSTFLPLGDYQIFLIPIYFIVTYTFTRRILGSLSVPLSSAVFILCIKSTPFVYWNTVFILAVIGYLLKKSRLISFS